MSVWFPVVQQLLSGTLDFAAGWQERQQAREEAKNEVRIKAMDSHNRDLKDEIVLFTAIYPMASPFVPFLRQNTIDALQVLKGFPEWAIGLYVTICMAVYGIQKLSKAKN